MDSATLFGMRERAKWADEHSNLGLAQRDRQSLLVYVDELQAKIKKYGGHTANCAYHLSHYKGPVSACDCGWTQEMTANNPGTAHD